MPRPAPAPSRMLDIIAGSLLGVALLLFLKRYAGINHDAVLYLGQGLVRRSPEIFGQDLAFVHGGGQERYTVFPWLLEHAIGWAPPGTVFAAGALLSILLFAAAGWYCLRSLLPAGERYWAWLGTVVLSSAYGVTTMFAYGEQFLTPRPFAEALCLVAIGLLARKRLLAGFACAALAAMFHPLQAIAAGLVVWPWLVMQNRRWLHALWVAVPVGLLAATGAGPFGGLLQRIDPEWLGTLRVATDQLFVGSWRLPFLSALVFDAFVLAYAWRCLDRPFSRWCGAALAGLGIGMLASLVLVDGLQLLLPAQLQLWRVHWLAHWLTTATLAVLLLRDLRAGDWPRALVLLLAFLLVQSKAMWGWPVLAAVYVAWPALSSRGRLRTLLGIVSGLGIATLFAMYLASELDSFRMSHYRLDLYAFDRRILLFPLLGLGLPLLAMLAWRRLTPAWQTLVIVVVLCPLVVAGATRWDARSPVNLAMEQAAFRSDIFGVAIPEDAQVYWGRHMLTGSWLVLRRASYFSLHQLAGGVFNRTVAIDGNARMERMRLLIEQGMGCDIWSASHAGQCHIGDDGMRRACEPGAQPGPDYLVLTFQQPQRSLGSWTITDPTTEEAAITFHLYRCSDVMEDLGKASRAPGG